MKILQLHPIMKTINGSERVVIELGKKLNIHGHQVIICSLAIAPECKKIISKKIRLIELGLNFAKNTYLGAFLQFITFPLLIFKIFRINPPDVIISYNSDPLVVALPYRFLIRFFSGKNIKLIYYCCEPPRFAYDLENLTKINLSIFKRIVLKISIYFFRFIDKLLVKKTDKIITLSNYSKKIISKIYNRNDISIIYPGVNQKKNDSDVNIDIRKKYNLENKIILLAVNKLHFRKNISFQIKAIKNLKKKFLKIHLLIVGEGPERLYLEGLTKRLELNSDITFAGFISEEELYSFYKQSDLFVFTAHKEPFGLVLLEAMANGKATIIPNEGGPLETCEHGKTGLFYKQNNLDDFINKISFLIKHPTIRRRFERNALNHSRKFTWNKFYSAITRIINMD